jgi:hypothetical protein
LNFYSVGVGSRYVSLKCLSNTDDYPEEAFENLADNDGALTDGSY